VKTQAIKTPTFKAQVLSAIALLIAGAASASAAEPAKVASLQSGIDVQYNDKSVKPQEDFYRHVNGTWLKNAQIPSDRSSAGAFMDLREAVVPRLHAIIDGLAKAKNASGSDAQKISDLYASFMDMKSIEAAGLKPLQADFAKIDALTDKKQIPALMAWLNRISVTAPYDIQVHQDNKDSTKYVLDIGQSGLALPDRDYYLKDDDAKLKDTRSKYLKHVETMLTMSGDKEAAKNAAAILAFETELAKVQWTKVDLRDPIKAYNKIEISKINELTAGYDWNAYLNELGVTGKIDYVIVGQPSYLVGMNKVLQETSLDTIKAYFKWHLLSSVASQLPKQYSDENFAFFSKTLRGVPEQEIRWKRGVRLVDSGMGESLGKLYVAKHFPLTAKRKWKNWSRICC
jgi:predicted metalloendopeptidase